MYETHNIVRGFRPAAKVEEDTANKKPQMRVHNVPKSFFEDFKMVTAENEDQFGFLAYFFAIQFLEKMTDDMWSLEFPACIGGEGRAILHEVAHYFGLACHSQGKSG